jgi:hypothetical protein
VKGYPLDHQRYDSLLHFHIKRLRESLSGRLAQIVVLSSWADLGYGKIGPRNDGNPQQTAVAHQIATLFAQRINFETKDDSTGVWIRYPGRVRARTMPDAVRVETLIDVAQSTSSSYTAARASARRRRACKSRTGRDGDATS